MKLAAGAITVLMLTGCSAGAEAQQPAPTPEAFTVVGQISVDLDIAEFSRTAGDTVAPGERCVADSGYDDIAAGTEVVVSDAGGTAVAIGRLTGGGLSESGESVYDSDCVFDFSVAGVPAGSAIYGVEIGRRGVERYSESEIRGRVLQLTLS